MIVINDFGVICLMLLISVCIYKNIKTELKQQALEHNQQKQKESIELLEKKLDKYCFIANMLADEVEDILEDLYGEKEEEIDYDGN